MIFTPLSKTGKRRLRFDVKPYETLRGRHNAFKHFEVETLKGRKLKAMVISCGLPNCFCDARLID